MDDARPATRKSKKQDLRHYQFAIIVSTVHIWPDTVPSAALQPARISHGHVESAPRASLHIPQITPRELTRFEAQLTITGIGASA